MLKLMIPHFLVGALIAGGGALVTAMNWAPATARSETVPVSVRENPSSYKPSYVIFTGWRPVPTSGGGYSSGK